MSCPKIYVLSKRFLKTATFTQWSKRKCASLRTWSIPTARTHAPARSASARNRTCHPWREAARRLHACCPDKKLSAFDLTTTYTSFQENSALYLSVLGRGNPNVTQAWQYTKVHNQHPHIHYLQPLILLSRKIELVKRFLSVEILILKSP